MLKLNRHPALFHLLVLAGIAAVLGLFLFQSLHHHADPNEALTCRWASVMLTAALLFSLSFIPVRSRTTFSIPLPLVSRHQPRVLFGQGFLLNLPPPGND